MEKKKWFWMVACVFIAGLSVWAVVSQTQSFDWDIFRADIIASNKWWLGLSVISMTGFIFCEGLAIRRILKAIAPEWKKERNCVLYASADIYFSAITPSASGGQPVMAIFMRRDGISMAEITSSLILNLILYTIATLCISVIGIIIRPGFIAGYNTLSLTMISLGVILLVVLVVAFWLLLFNDKLLEKIVDGVFRLINKIAHFKDSDAKRARLKKMMSEYQDCAKVMAGQKKMIFSALGWNFLQRLSQSMVAVFLFFATGGALRDAVDAWLTQVFSLVGSSCLPIPGGMGAADYLLIDGFSHVSGVKSAANMALLCRGISFYSCVIISALIVLIGYLSGKDKK